MLVGASVPRPQIPIQRIQRIPRTPGEAHPLSLRASCEDLIEGAGLWILDSAGGAGVWACLGPSLSHVEVIPRYGHRKCLKPDTHVVHSRVRDQIAGRLFVSHHSRHNQNCWFFNRQAKAHTQTRICTYIYIYIRICIPTQTRSPRVSTCLFYKMFCSTLSYRHVGPHRCNHDVCLCGQVSLHSYCARHCPRE